MRRVISLVVVIACGGKPAPAPVAPVAVAPAPAKPALPAGIPDNLAGRKLAWVLDVIGKSGNVERAELEANFAASFLKAVPDAQLKAAFVQMHDLVVIDARTDAAGMQL